MRAGRQKFQRVASLVSALIGRRFADIARSRQRGLYSAFGVSADGSEPPHGEPRVWASCCHAVALVLVCLAIAAAPAGAQVAPNVTYFTSYEGTYSFESSSNCTSFDMCGRPQPSSLSETYDWQAIMADEFYMHPNRTYSEVIEYTVDAQGGSHQLETDSSGLNSYTRDCQIHASIGGPVFESLRTEGRVPRTLLPSFLVRKNPLLLVRWAAPIYADPNPPLKGGPTGSWGLFDAPGVSKTCQASNGVPILPSMPSEQLVTYDVLYGLDQLNHQGTSCGGKRLEPNPFSSHLAFGNDFWDVMSSDRELNTLGAVVRFADLPYDRQFVFSNGISGPEVLPGGFVQPGYTCSQSVSYHSRVVFDVDSHFSCKARGSRPVPLPRRAHVVNPAPSSGPTFIPPGVHAVSFAPSGAVPCNKIGSLLLKDGLAILGGNTVAPGNQSIANGQVTSVLFPGMNGIGTVTGQVLPSGGHAVEQHSAAGGALFAAAHQTALYTARASVTTDRPFTLVLKPTAAGLALLRRHHGRLTLVATATFAPRNKHQPHASSRLTFTVPAT